jgi:deoxyribonuclease V
LNNYKSQIYGHTWDLSPLEASALQSELAKQVVREMQSGDVATVAGIDVGIHVGVSRAAVVVLDYPGLETVEYAVATRPVTFPYIPGLLSFREGPVILDALKKLSAAPDLLIFDGQGVAHPRRLGIASHIGLLVDLPSIGCAKSRLCGKYEEPGFERGSHVPLMDKGETIGSVVRTRSGVKPVFVSVGHRLDLRTSVDYVLACCRGYRLPETTRRAHLMASKTR